MRATLTLNPQPSTLNPQPSTLNPQSLQTQSRAAMRAVLNDSLTALRSLVALRRSQVRVSGVGGYVAVGGVGKEGGKNKGGGGGFIQSR